MPDPGAPPDLAAALGMCVSVRWASAARWREKEKQPGKKCEGSSRGPLFCSFYSVAIKHAEASGPAADGRRSRVSC